MYCSNCGAPTSPGATFCAKCGATLPPAAGAPAASTAPPPPSPVAAAPGVPGPAPVAAVPRPTLAVGDLVSTSFRQAFSGFGTFLGTQGVFVLLAAAVGIAMSIAFVGPGMRDIFQDMQGGDPDFAAMFATMARIVAVGLVGGLVNLALNVLGAAVGLTVAEGLRRGERLSLGEAWARMRPRLGNFLLTSLLIAGAIIGVILVGTMLFFLVLPIIAGVVLAFYLAVRWAVAPAVSLFEDRRPTENLTRASDLTAGSRGAIFGAIVVFVLISIIPSAIVGAVFSPDVSPGATPDEILDAATPSVTQLVIQGVINAVFSLIAAFVGSAFVVHAYRTLAGAPA